NTITAILGSIPNGVSPTVTITLRPTAPGTYTQQATVSGNGCESDLSNNSVISSITVSPPEADLSLVQAISSLSVPVGNQIVYTLTVKNNGPETAPAVTLSDALPAEVSFVSAHTSPGTVTQSAGNLIASL